MALEFKLGPRQAEVAEKARAFLRGAARPLLEELQKSARPEPRKVVELRTAAGDAGVLCPDAPDAAGRFGPLPDAMGVAEVLGQELPRALSVLLVDGTPARLLGVSDKTSQQLRACVQGALQVALLDVSAAGVALERRPGGASRLSGEVPAIMVPPDCPHLLFVFEERQDWLALALVSTTHAPLRTDPLSDLPMIMVQGLLDVAVPDEQLVGEAALEVIRALAAEELIRSARSLGEAHGALTRTVSLLGSRRLPLGVVEPLLAEASTALLQARTANYAAAERLQDGGPYTLVGEEVRFANISAALEARSVARQALHGAATVMDACVRLQMLTGELPTAELQAAFLASRRDIGAIGSVDITRTPWHRLGDNRMGAVPALRGRLAPQKPDSRPPEGGENGERKSSTPTRGGTQRMTLPHAEWGPLPFVPDDARRAQLETRKLVGEVLYAASPHVEKEGAIPEATVETLRGRSWPGSALVTEPGAAGLLVYLTTQEELGRAHSAFGAWLGACAGAAAQGLLLGGQDGLRGSTLPGLQAGTTAATLALGEHGGPLVGARTGDELLRVEGGAQAFYAGPRADAFVVLARERGGPAGSLLWISRGQEGLTVTEANAPPGACPLRRVQLTFKDALVPARNILGAPGDGPLLAERLVDIERLDMAVRALGLSTHALELWRAALTGRKPGTLLAQARPLGQLWARLAQARALLWSTAVRVAVGERRPSETAAVKLAATELCTQILDQVVAGAGSETLAAGSPLVDGVRAGRAWQTLGGSVESLRQALAADALAG
ncbi:MAG: acyl-CoA dehydrogenase family protein [Myxococcota bacterium]